MASVEDRIVRMEFDNAAFERKIATTLASLGQLDRALKLTGTGASKGLNDVSDAISKVDTSSISRGIEGVSRSFLALGTIAITTLSQITSSALRAGAQFVKAFTLQPILDGFREFETNANSIQVILSNTASKGTTLDQVNEALQKLNEYSDQTIYNFAQMARNIGTFTAAGVDLDTSVNAIKGIANLAAVSGSNSEQASTAMYQLSQAIAAGSVKLMDWNSVVNAGMGGEVFKNALFETGKAMGNVLNVPLDQTFQQWEDSGNSFRESLQEGWITADILTTTLSTFTGDMTEQMLLAKGFNQQQVEAILKTAAMARAAATEVKTFTQLLGTVKEAVGTGFADSFRIIIGNFEEAKTLFTGINNAIGGFIQRSADARNEILQGWKDFGGRAQLIEALQQAFYNLGRIIGAVREAFSNIFPPITAATLIRLTDSFAKFVESMKPTEEALDKIRRVAQGFFSVLGIGWEIVKEGTKFLINLGKSLLSLIAPEATGFLAKLGDGLTNLHDVLVKGGGIKSFFEGLTKILRKPIELLQKLKEAIGSIFDSFDDKASEAAAAGIERFGSRFENLKQLFSSAGNLWEPFENALRKIVEVLDKTWQVIKDWFSELGQKLKDAIGPGEFNNILDAFNTGLLGGIALLLAKFIKTGFNFDIGSGLLEKVGKSFEELTGVLTAMQANIRANALLKIASAIAILTASVVVLSLIDSAALTRALTAMAVGFGQLMAAFRVMTKEFATPAQALSFTIMATGLISLAGAILVLSVAVKILSTMNWEDLAKGLSATTVLLAELVLASKILSANVGGMISAGVGITAMAVALVILSVAMKVFATMSWEEIAKGLVSIAGGLVIIAAAMHAMPATLPITATGLILVSVGLTLLAGAMKLFATMSWEEIAKGLVATGGGLVIIAGAMQLMPITLPITAAGLILVGLALTEIGAAMKIMASMSWSQIARGLVSMGGALLILAAAMFVMQANIGGAVAIGIVAVSLGILAKVLKSFSSLSWGDLLHGLAAVAISLGAIALAALIVQPAVPAILALGTALIVLGAGFALIGAGAMFVGKALESVAKSGKAAAEAIPEIIKSVAQAIPALATGLAKGLLGFVKVFTDAAPAIAKSLGVLLEHIIETIIKLTPKVMKALDQLIGEMIDLIEKQGPPLIKLGIFLIVSLLKGIRDKIDGIVTVVADILKNFLDAFAREIPAVAERLANLLITLYTTAAFEVGKVAGTLLIGIGKNFIQGFFTGLNSQLGPIMSFFTGLAGNILVWIGDALSALWQKGVDILTGFIIGYISVWWDVVNFFSNLPSSIVGFVGDLLGTLFNAGKNLIGGLWNGIQEAFKQVRDFFENSISGLKHLIPNPINILFDVGKKIIKGLWDGMKDMWDSAKDWVGGIADDIISIKGPPKKDAILLVNNGMLIMQGLQKGMEDEWGNVSEWLGKVDPAESMDKNFGNSMTKILRAVSDKMSTIEDINPVITPVLDLTQVENGWRVIDSHHHRITKLIPELSTKHARAISRHQVSAQETSGNDQDVSGSVTYQQNIYSPTRLSTRDIYKNTRNQITIAKEELSIP